MTPTSLREQLARDEGLRLRPYQDSVGKWTIGFGRNLSDRGVSLAEAELMLTNDITQATSDVLRELAWTRSLDEIRREALVNLTFNVGIGGTLGFKKMLAAMEREDYETAAKELLDSKYRKQVGVRAERLSRQILTGERQ